MKDLLMLFSPIFLLLSPCQVQTSSSAPRTSTASVYILTLNWRTKFGTHTDLHCCQLRHADNLPMSNSSIYIYLAQSSLNAVRIARQQNVTAVRAGTAVRFIAHWPDLRLSKTYRILLRPIHTQHAVPMPCSDHAALLNATAQHGRRETACRLPDRVLLLPTTKRSSTKVVIRSIPISDAGGQCETKQRLSRTRKRVVATHFKKDDLLNCWTSSSNISG